MPTFEIRCSNCGAADTVPFKPRPGGSPLLCRGCFRAKSGDVLPPMPSDPRYCRWCRKRRRMILPTDPVEAWPCPSGCAPNHDTPYQRRCAECSREFRTGSTFQDLCWFHERREQRELARLGSEFTPRATGYMADMSRKRADRHAYRILLEQKEEAGDLNENERASLARLRETMSHARSR
jgi:CxxC-x17-CxxC domain-containing protein